MGAIKYIIFFGCITLVAVSRAENVIDTADKPVFSCKIADLKPPQFNVGIEEVKDKVDELRSKKNKSKLESYKEKHPEPVVKGPNQHCTSLITIISRAPSPTWRIQLAQPRDILGKMAAKNCLSEGPRRG
jgi:Putative ParB-like nuclease